MHSDEPEQMHRKTSVGTQRESQDGLRGSQDASQGPQATLEYISDSYEDEDLDEKISKILDRIRTDLNELDILGVVIELCPQLQATREQIFDFLEAYPQLEELAWKAANSRNFKDIRRLVIFQKSAMVQPRLSIKQQELSRRQVAAVENAWTGTYIKGGEQLLLKTIIDINTNRLRDVYDNSLTIVQSSGTGKSRTVHELAKYVFTIPLNIRTEDENVAYPKSDRMLRDYLLGEVKTQDQLQTRFLSFFAHLFVCIVQEFQTKGFIDCLAQASADRSPSEIVAQAWFEHLQASHGEGTNRTKLYKKVVRCCKSSVFPIEDAGEVVDVDVEAGKAEGKQRGRPGSPPASMTPKHPVDNQIAKEKERPLEVEGSAKRKLIDLIRRIEELAGQMSGKTTYEEVQGASKKTRPARVVMYVDEAHSMTCKRAPGLFQRSYYNEFVSACNSFTHSDIFFLYLSTSSSLNEVALPFKGNPSARVNITKAEGKDTIQVPFTELPFDCLAGHEGFTLLSISNNRTALSKTLSEVSTLRFMSQFGRPLFGTFLKALVGPDEDEVSNDVFADTIRLARAKLLCRADPEDIGEYETATSYLALFGVRILLQYSIGRKRAREKILKLVESHMAIAYSVPQHRETIAMGYPSEPVLAEAAAQHFYYLREQKQVSSLRALLPLINDGYANKGERGELAARLLFMLAYDDAIVNHQKGALVLNFSKGVPMEDFIRALFTDEHAEAILNSLPDNVADEKIFKEAFKDVWIRFTHFGLSEDANFVDATAMCLAFARGMGVQFSSQQEGVDLGIPGFHRYTKNEKGQAEEQHLCEQFVTAIWVQVNNHLQAVPTSQTEFTAEELNLFPDGSSGRAYVALIMNLGVENNNLGVEVNLNVTRKSLREPNSPVHPRYSIHAYGCRSGVYKVVSQADEDVFRSLLEPSIVTAHPRQTDESLYALKKLKPYWKKDAARCDWANDWANE